MVICFDTDNYFPGNIYVKGLSPDIVLVKNDIPISVPDFNGNYAGFGFNGNVQNVAFWMQCFFIAPSSKA